MMKGLLLAAFGAAIGISAAYRSATRASVPPLSAPVAMLDHNRVRAVGTVISVAHKDALSSVQMEGRRPVIHMLHYGTQSEPVPTIMLAIDHLRVRIRDPRFAERLDLAGKSVLVTGTLKLGPLGEADLELEDFTEES